MGTLEQLVHELTKTFRPLVNRIENREIILLLEELGLQLPAAAQANANFTTTLNNVKTAIEELVTSFDALRSAIGADDKPALLQAAIQCVKKLKETLDALPALANSIKNDIGAAAIGISNAELDAFVDALPGRLTEYLLVNRIENASRAAADVMEFLGMVQRTEISDTGNPALPAFTKKEVDPSALLDFITNPGKHLKNKFDWNKPEFDGSKLFSMLAKVLLARGIPVLYDEVNAPTTINIFFARISIDNSGPLPGLLIKPLIDGYEANFHTEGEAWKFDTGFEMNISNDAQLSVFPDGTLKMTMPGFTGGKLSASWQAGYPDKKMQILAISGASRIEADSFKISIENTIAPDGNGAFSFAAELNKIHVIVDLSEGDGFTKKVGGSGFDSEIDLKFGYSTEAGFFIKGSGSLEINVPTHISIGPIDITALTIKLSPSQGQLALTVGGDIRAFLGPLLVIINNIGFKLSFNSRDDNSGNLGRINVEPGFKFPEGIGLSIDAGGFKGGGIINFDPENKEYFGGLELEFKDMFSLKAFAIINTRMPDGSDDFSLLIIITAEFSPIQLGYGFTLNGVGGLFGYNRTVKLDVLREGIKTNAIESILFPKDIVANINRIVSDIKQVFPPQHGRFLICPMGKIGWGTPTLITLELGILVEIPATGFAILGVLKALLPREDAPILKLQVNFVGIVDFENKYISFDAILFDSKLLTFTLSGQMALRIGWGDKKVFILSVGGFHPAFKEIPVDLQNMQRVTISLLNEEDARISIQTYFAVTSNTAQFGARAELYAEQGGFNIYGFIGYDVLFQFDPFKFIADFAAGVALRRHSSVIMSIKVAGVLSGPGRWDAHGEASISFFFFSVSVHFHKSWGDAEGDNVIEKADLLDLLAKEVNDNRNWKADLPLNNKLQVSTRQTQAEGGAAVVHPFCILTFSERLVPLDLEINKFGNQVPKDANKFEIKTTDTSLTTVPVTEPFAPANFMKMSDEEKLSRPSFEQMKSGFQITGSSALKVPSEDIVKKVDYEFSYLGREAKHDYRYPGSFFNANLKSSAASLSTLSYANNRISFNAPESILLEEEQFAVANVSDMKLHDDKMVAGSYTEALQFYNTLVREKPELKNQLQVVSQYELNPN